MNRLLQLTAAIAFAPAVLLLTETTMAQPGASPAPSAAPSALPPPPPPPPARVTPPKPAGAAIPPPAPLPSPLPAPPPPPPPGIAPALPPTPTSGDLPPPPAPPPGYTPAPEYTPPSPVRRSPHAAPYAAQSELEYPPRDEPGSREVWYGYQILAAFGVSHLTLIVGAATEDATLIGIGIGGHFLSAPIVHWANAEVGRGFGSLAMNVGLPIGGFFVGYGLGAIIDDPPTSGVAAFIVGAMGLIAAPVIDLAVLAYKKPSGSSDSAAGWPTRVMLAPVLGHKLTGVGIGGQF